jgi:NADPH:quinone reductase-like Zn-dependent oxidoreductase
MMNAISQDRYGDPDVLEFTNVPEPIIGEDEVLVRVRAAGVGAAAWHLMTGLPYLVRISGYGLTRPKYRIPGTDVAGLVEATGRRVTRFKPGDEVFGECVGAYAEFACAREDLLVSKPHNVTFEQAAVVVDSGHTALIGLRDVGKVEPGQRVLVIGAGGGVGTYAVQIAKALGAEVTGVCSTTKLEFVRTIGADHAIDYTREDFADGRQRYDVIFDTAGRRSLPHLRRGLTREGTLVIVGGEGGGRWFGGTQRQIRAMITSPFIRQSLRVFVSMPSLEGIGALKDLIETEKIAPIVGRQFPLSETPQAIRHWPQGHTRGKIAITV